MLMGVREGDQPDQPAASFVQRSPHLPEAPEGMPEAQAGLGGVRLDRPPERGPEVRGRPLQPIEPCLGLGPPQLRGRAHGEVHEDASVAPADLAGLAGRGQLLEGELADGLQHEEAWFAVRSLVAPDQALVDQTVEPVEGVDSELGDGAADRLRLLELPAPANTPRRASRRWRPDRAGRGSTRSSRAGSAGAPGLAGAAGQESSRSVSRARIGCGARTRIRAAASSIARGSPSRRAQISATAAAFWPVSAKSGGRPGRDRRTGRPPPSAGGRRRRGDGPGPATRGAGPAAPVRRPPGAGRGSWR